MVEFSNIQVKDGYIYAIETDLMTGETAKIKLSITKEEYYSDPALTTVPMKRALWNLQYRYEKRKSLESREIISWG